MSAAATLDAAKSEGFAQSLVEVMNHSGLALMLSVGRRTGLFDVLARLERATSNSIACRRSMPRGSRAPSNAE